MYQILKQTWNCPSNKHCKIRNSESLNEKIKPNKLKWRFTGNTNKFLLLSLYKGYLHLQGWIFHRPQLSLSVCLYRFALKLFTCISFTMYTNVYLKMIDALSETSIPLHLCLVTNALICTQTHTNLCTQTITVYWHSKLCA